MKEEYVDELDDTLDDVEPVVDNPAELYEHFRVVVDKGQSQVRGGQMICSNGLSTLRATVFRRLPTPVLSWRTANR